MFEDDELSTFFEAAATIAYGRLPVLRRNVMEYAGSKDQVEFAISAELFHRHEPACRVLLASERKTSSRWITAGYVGVRKDLAQVGHAPANPAAEIKNRACRAGELPCQFDFVASEIVAVTVEEVRLRGEDRLIPSGILIEIDACHQLSSCIGPGHRLCPHIHHDKYANKK